MRSEFINAQAYTGNVQNDQGADIKLAADTLMTTSYNTVGMRLFASL